MLLYGASGHAKVIISCLRANGVEVFAIFDDDVSKKELWGVPVVGAYDPNFEPNQPIIISIGYNNIREKIAELIQHKVGQIFHSSAEVDDSVRIGEGSVVFHHATIQADAVVGKHCIVNTSSSIDHDCQLADFVHIAPNATLCGSVQIGTGTLIGAGSIVAPNLKIGKNCLITAGSVITRNIPDGAIVRGNPGRIIKINA
jgi:sugar O-acyltransferase (sialic acid O-acetyltransferase NeuD family)